MAVKSTRGFALKSTHGIAIKSTNLASGENMPIRRNTRQFYDGEESCYIIDAKLEGNLGRYLNVRLSLLYLTARLNFPLLAQLWCFSSVQADLSLPL